MGNAAKWGKFAAGMVSAVALVDVAEASAVRNPKCVPMKDVAQKSKHVGEY